jgi:hypothetical protein
VNGVLRSNSISHRIRDDIDFNARVRSDGEGRVTRIRDASLLSFRRKRLAGSSVREDRVKGWSRRSPCVVPVEESRGIKRRFCGGMIGGQKVGERFEWVARFFNPDDEKNTKSKCLTLFPAPRLFFTTEVLPDEFSTARTSDPFADPVVTRLRRVFCPAVTLLSGRIRLGRLSQPASKSPD